MGYNFNIDHPSKGNYGQNQYLTSTIRINSDTNIIIDTGVFVPTAFQIANALKEIYTTMGFSVIRE